jgi:trehalose 6-phosphate synthase
MPLRDAMASRALRMGILVAGVVGVVTGFLAWLQVERERHVDLDDLDKRALALAYQMADRLRDPLSRPDAFKIESVSLEGFRRLLGYSLFGPDGRMVAAGKAVAEFVAELKELVGRAMVEGKEISDDIQSHGSHVHVLAYPINDHAGRLTGVLTVLHDITHLDDRAAARLTQFGFWILIVSLLLVTLVVGSLWLAYDRPLKNLAEWMRRLRLENVPESPPVGLPVALLGTESSRLAASFRAARSAGWVESRALVRVHNLWTRERLRAQAIDALRMRQLVVVSNREPYMHQFREGKPRLIVPAGGLVTALDPVLQACGGLWVAHGAGDADRETADAGGRLTVPPVDPRYTLRRVWLSREEEQGYYYGLANEGLWPLCHLAHERPVFRASDWEHYVRANRKFAAAVLEEIGSGEATVLVQDYHLALLPQLLKAGRPDIRVGIFWHIPWPNPEAFRICPWRVEILQGMLGADLIGFHLQQYSNNFLDTVDRMVEARLSWDQFAVELKGRTSLVRPYPISVESWAERGVPAGEALERHIAALREQHKLGTGAIAVGVDRIDYTKGLPERFRAISRFFEKYPRHRGKLTFVQLGAPSRTHLRRYRDLISELESLADEINWRFETEDWKPIRFLVGHHGAPEVHAFMRMASTCVVSSLHDGMNLVAKEYVAAKEDLDGVLILSEFAGAARELSEALIINPYDIEQFAEAIRAAVEMDEDERHRRMEQLRRGVEERNIYWWAAKFLTELAATRSARAAPQEAEAEEPASCEVPAATAPAVQLQDPGNHGRPS